MYYHSNLTVLQDKAVPAGADAHQLVGRFLRYAAAQGQLLQVLKALDFIDRSPGACKCQYSPKCGRLIGRVRHVCGPNAKK